MTNAERIRRPVTVNSFGWCEVEIPGLTGKRLINAVQANIKFLRWEYTLHDGGTVIGTVDVIRSMMRDGIRCYGVFST